MAGQTSRLALFMIWHQAVPFTMVSDGSSLTAW
jgi:hypothetical protein